MTYQEKPAASRLPKDGPSTAVADPKPATNGKSAPATSPVAPTEEPKKRGRRKGKRRRAAGGGARVARLFPPTAFQDALQLADGIQEHASGRPVDRLLLLQQMGKSESSRATRMMITASSQYGLTNGGYQAAELSLTPEGAAATSDLPPLERLTAQFKLAIDHIAPFKHLYDEYKTNKLPAKAVLEDAVKKQGVPDEDAAECVESFLVNLKFLQMLRPLAGAERILTPEQAIAGGMLPQATGPAAPAASTAHLAPGGGEVAPPSGSTDWDKVCFYMTPIGEQDSEQRKHADLFLNHVIEPALKEFGLHVVRADKIGKPGLITAQVMEHVVRSRLVVVDLSFHNPSVFYELALRHTCGLPTVQIIRSRDKIPFDVADMRTVVIDNTDIYTLLPQMQTYHAEIANQVRRALQPGGDAPNPISAAVPGLKVTFPPPRGA
jgi:hypothetical protein